MNEGKQDPGRRLHIYLYISTIDYKSLLKTIVGLINLVMSLCGTIFTFSLVSFYAGELLRLFLILSLTIISTTFSSFIFTLSLQED